MTRSATHDTRFAQPEQQHDNDMEDRERRAQFT